MSRRTQHESHTQHWYHQLLQAEPLCREHHYEMWRSCQSRAQTGSAGDLDLVLSHRDHVSGDHWQWSPHYTPYLPSSKCDHPISWHSAGHLHQVHHQPSVSSWVVTRSVAMSTDQCVPGLITQANNSLMHWSTKLNESIEIHVMRSKDDDNLECPTSKLTQEIVVQLWC